MRLLPSSAQGKTVGGFWWLAPSPNGKPVEEVVQPRCLETRLRNLSGGMVSFHRTDQRFYAQRNPANEIWWKSR